METHHYGLSGYPDVTSRWYDGGDRLVEVSLPHDPTDFFPTWLTRYIYAQGTNQVTVSDNQTAENFYAYGAQYKTQRYVPPPPYTKAFATPSPVPTGATPAPPTPAPSPDIAKRMTISPNICYPYCPTPHPSGTPWPTPKPSATPTGTATPIPTPAPTATPIPPPYEWQDTIGQAYDAAGRITTQYRLQPGGTFHAENYVYDGTTQVGQLPGELDSYTNATGDSVSFTYDATGDVLTRSYVAGTESTSPYGYDTTPPTETMTYDADGRLTSENNAAIGTSLVGYDADGNVTSYTEPQSPGSGYPFAPTLSTLSNPASFQYSYYASGLPSGFSINTTAGGVLNYSRQYDYRGDGALTKQVTSDYGATWTFQAGYTPGGKLTSKIDPLSANALSVTYDQYTGQIAKWAIPEGTYTILSYDPEGDVTQFQDSAKPTWGWTDFQFGYSARGELLSEVGSVDDNGTPETKTFLNQRSADGYMSSTGSGFDPRVSAAIGSYDLDGRAQGPLYDALNRIIGTAAGGAHAYAYGIGTIPIQDGQFYSSATSLTHHASLDSEPVFTTEAKTNEATDIKLSDSSDLVPGDPYYLVEMDRDMFGYVAGMRTASTMSQWTFPNPYSSCDSSGNLANTVTLTSATNTPLPAEATCGSPNGLYPFRTDGYWNGQLTFRGARAYSDANNQWLTPDMYSGDPSNPISALTYNYGGNNPLIYEDPSGFDDALQSSDCPAGSSDMTGWNALSGSQDCFSTSGTAGIDEGLPTIANITVGSGSGSGTCGACVSQGGSGRGGDDGDGYGAAPHRCTYDQNGISMTCEMPDGKLLSVRVMTSPGCVAKGAAFGALDGLGFNIAKNSIAATATVAQQSAEGAGKVVIFKAGSATFLGIASKSSVYGTVAMVAIGALIGGSKAAATGCGGGS